MREKKLFEDAVVSKIREKIQNDGLEGVDTKELLVLIADYFNDSIGNIENIVNDSVGSIQNIVNDSIGSIQKIGNEIRRAMWAIFASLIASLIAGIIIALVAQK